MIGRQNVRLGTQAPFYRHGDHLLQDLCTNSRLTVLKHLKRLGKCSLQSQHRL
nr:MAG TPA: hypothetical protein [Caudoviricetes sp.]